MKNSSSTFLMICMKGCFKGTKTEWHTLNPSQNRVKNVSETKSFVCHYRKERQGQIIVYLTKGISPKTRSEEDYSRIKEYLFPKLVRHLSQPAYPDTNLGRMMTHICSQCHRLLNYLMIDTGGIQKVQGTIFTPCSNADVSNIQT